MLKYVASRILQIIPVLFGVSVAIFLLIRLVPGDPADYLAGPETTPDVLQAVRRTFGLDQPIYVQYIRWIENGLHGDFGKSTASGFPASSLVMARFPDTLMLAGGGFLITLAVGFILGSASGLRSGGVLDRIVQVVNSVLLSVPSFWFGIIAILVFATYLRWLPPGGSAGAGADVGSYAAHLILPATALGLHQGPVLARLLRTSILEVLNEDYVRTARSKGISSMEIVTKHIIKPAMTPVITMSGVVAGRLLGGVVIIETVFNWPGVGSLLVQSIMKRDYAVVQFSMLLIVTLYIVINLVADVLCGVNDPRTRR